MPTFPLETQAFLRVAVGVLQITFFIIILPFSRTYFTTERYGGCLESHRWTDALFRPGGYRLLMAVWIGTLALLTFGVAPVFTAFINLFLCYFFFITLRWKSPLRGMGAPGFISYWLAALLFLLEYATYFGDAEGRLRALVVLAFRFDFAVMMIDSGINKIFHGYPANRGMNFGMANPAWGYWYPLFQKLPPRHWMFRFFNHSAYFFQILGGICLLFPPSQWIGALIIFGSFLFVKCVIRLGVLCDMLMLITVIYTRPDGWFHGLLAAGFPPVSAGLIGAHPAPALVNGAIGAVLWAYILLLVPAKLAMYTNFYLKKRLPPFFQKMLETFTNTFGVILWRVFTIDLIDFFIRVSFEDKATGKRALYSRFGRWHPRKTNRFLWVGESIMSLIVFNTERYFPQTELFRRRLMLYARTMPCPPGHRIIFEYVYLYPGESSYEFIPVKEYRTDPSSGELEVRSLREDVLEHRKRWSSPVRPAARPGSYAPVDSKNQTQKG